jgi:hypothetical protein
MLFKYNSYASTKSEEEKTDYEKLTPGKCPVYVITIGSGPTPPVDIHAKEIREDNQE